MRITTELGVITLVLRPEAAPTTVAHIAKLASHKLFDSTSFYRSDFVIQCGLHVRCSSAPRNTPHPLPDAHARARTPFRPTAHPTPILSDPAPNRGPEK